VRKINKKTDTEAELDRRIEYYQLSIVEF